MSQYFIQLREEFDQGWEIQMDEENSIHDVAALLKEFFRDLPDPLLARDLYTAFINTTCKQHIVKHTRKFKIKSINQNQPPFGNTSSSICTFKLVKLVFTVLDPSDQERALQLLIFLLPPCNSDTLHRLLCLLSTVAAHAEDSLDSEGQEVTEITYPYSLKAFVAWRKILWTDPDKLSVCPVNYIITYTKPC